MPGLRPGDAKTRHRAMRSAVPPASSAPYDPDRLPRLSETLLMIFPTATTRNS